MKCIYKVRHKPSGRFLTGSNYRDGLRLTGKSPVGKVWNSYKDALSHAQSWELFNKDYIPSLGLFEVVEYSLTEISSTQVK